MSRTRTCAALGLLGLVVLALPGGSSGDASSPTWAGVWDSDFGRMTLDAGGSGHYEGFSPGTIEGNVDGRVNQGTWHQPGDPPKSGTFRFTMSGDGLSFTGDWAYDGGGCGTACGWNGTCVAGACLENDDPAPVMPPACTGSGATAFAAARCTKLPFGVEASIPAPGESRPVEASPEQTPATAEEVRLAIRELLFEEEKNELLASIKLAVEKDPTFGNAFVGCLIIGTDLTGSRHLRYDEGGLALLRACRQLLVENTAHALPAAKPTGAGCQAVFVPAFPKGEKVTRRKRRRAVAAARRQLDVSCTLRPGRLSASIRARHGKKLRKVTRSRLRTFVGRRLAPGATRDPDQRLGVRWRARGG